MSRVYCWRIGKALPPDADGKCTECGHKYGTPGEYGHRLVADDSCQAYADCPRASAHGHPCKLPIGHSGEHKTDACEVVL